MCQVICPTQQALGCHDHAVHVSVRIASHVKQKISANANSMPRLSSGMAAVKVSMFWQPTLYLDVSDRQRDRVEERKF